MGELPEWLESSRSVALKIEGCSSLYDEKNE